MARANRPIGAIASTPSVMRDREQAAVDEGGDQDRQHERRERQEDQEHERHDPVPPTPEVPGEDAERATDDACRTGSPRTRPPMTCGRPRSCARTCPGRPRRCRTSAARGCVRRTAERSLYDEVDLSGSLIGSHGARMARTTISTTQPIATQNMPPSRRGAAAVGVVVVVSAAAITHRFAHARTRGSISV